MSQYISMVYRWRKEICPTTMANGKCIPQIHRSKQGDVAAYRRGQNLYAKNTEGLQRAVTVQRLVHNWVRPHVGLGKNKTPSMAIGLYYRPISMLELLSLRGFHSLTI
jgi:hypothetical protein